MLLGESFALGLLALLLLHLHLLLEVLLPPPLLLGLLLRLKRTLLVLVLFEHCRLLAEHVGVRRGRGRRRRWRLCCCRRCWPFRQLRCLPVVQQVRWVRTELGNVDEPREVLEIRAFKVKLAQIVVLRVVPRPQRLEGVYIPRTTVHRAEHRCDEAVDIVRFLDEWDKRRDTALVVH